MSTHLPEIFSSHLHTIHLALKQASKSENPALHLFKHNARTPLFYAESICRMMSKMDNKKPWDKWKDAFKSIEDGLGTIDYWHGHWETATKNKKIPVDLKAYFYHKYMLSAMNLNQTLIKEAWIWNSTPKISKAIKKLEEIQWPEDEDLAAKIMQYYYLEIEKIETELTGSFEDIEKDLHELRRAIRWLSILPQALPGFFVYKNDKPNHINKKYLIASIQKSPYNILKEVKSIKHTITLNKTNYLSLSWLIFILGALKDEGQKIEAFVGAYETILSLTQEEIENEMKMVFGKNQKSSKMVLDESKEIAAQFYNDNILENLISI